MWKTDKIPHRFKKAVLSVKRYHPGWDYYLWTDKEIDQYVKKKYPDFFPVFDNFSRQIMRIDIMRYIIMKDIGGVYCDLDYEFLRPFDYAGYDIVFSLERDINYGDRESGVANAFIASCPGHPFWHYLFQQIQKKPPVTHNYLEVLTETGPGFLSRHFFEAYKKHNWPNINLTPKPVFSPYRVRGKHERKLLLNNGITHGIHLGAGTWKERLSAKYLLTKIKRLATKRASSPQKFD